MLTFLGCASTPGTSSFVRVEPGWTPAQIVSTSRPTILLVWAPWCEECLGLLEPFDSLTATHGKRLSMVTVCIVEGHDEFAPAELPATRRPPHYIWSTTIDEALAEFDLTGLPGLLVYDANGVAVERVSSSALSGPMSPADLADAIDTVASQ